MAMDELPLAFRQRRQEMAELARSILGKSVDSVEEAPDNPASEAPPSIAPPSVGPDVIEIADDSSGEERHEEGHLQKRSRPR